VAGMFSYPPQLCTCECQWRAALLGRDLAALPNNSLGKPTIGFLPKGQYLRWIRIDQAPSTKESSRKQQMKLCHQRTTDVPTIR